MVKIRTNRRSKRINKFNTTWFLVGIVLTLCGYTGTLTFLKNASNNAGLEGNSNKSMSMVAAISAQRILSNGKPYLIYGTAWKENETTHHVLEAIKSGFRFIDTACQPKHYNEKAVGLGIAHAMETLSLQRQDLFIQTKFTSVDGQDPNRIPYDKNADLEDQVRQSIEVSLMNLKTTYIDSLIMHSPMRTMEDTLRVWRVFESLVDEGKVHYIGISNCYNLEKFQSIYNNARIKPKFLQNRFYDKAGFDVDLRNFCRENNVTYQSFWTLTGNRHALNSKRAKEMAEAKGLTPQTLMYAFMMTLGHTPLDGTTNQIHMMEDVAIMERIQNNEEILNDEEMKEMAALLGTSLFVL